MLKRCLLLLGLLLPVSQANACAFHWTAGDGQGVYPPGAVRIILGSAYAEQHGPLQPIPALEDGAAFQRASWLLRLLSRHLEQGELSQTYVVLVDVPLWSVYKPGEGMTVDIEPPEDYSNVLLLTQASLAALVRDNLGFAEAISANVAQVYQDQEGTEARLRRL